MADRLTVTVTEKDVDKGIGQDCKRCATALAFNRVNRKAHAFIDAVGEVFLGWDGGGCVPAADYVPADARVVKFIKWFDNAEVNDETGERDGALRRALPADAGVRSGGRDPHVMLIHRIELRNFKSFASAVIDLPAGLTAIVGHNGAGKTAILQAIGLGVFNVRPRPLASVMRGDATDTTVEIEFTSGQDDRRYRVVRKLHRTRARATGELSANATMDSEILDVQQDRVFEQRADDVEAVPCRSTWGSRASAGRTRSSRA